MMKSQHAVRRVTIADVARHAGVSTAAVSKVLRNAYGVSDGMSQRVRSSMAELGYRPHAAARGMRGRSFTIGLLLDNIRNPFYGDFLDGVTDGLILVAPSMSRSQVIAVAKTIPTVVVAHHDTGDEYDSVVDDDRAGAALAVDHLVALGHRRIAHTTAVAPGSQWKGRPEQVRSEGYRQAMHRHGLDEAVNIAGTSYSEEGGYQAGRELLDRPDRPTAIFAGADFAALGVLRAAYELGLRVPADLSLVGYDNTTLAASAPINFTSVDQAAHDLGATAARLLCERMDGRSRSVLTSTAPQLIIRDTTAPPSS